MSHFVPYFCQNLVKCHGLTPFWPFVAFQVKGWSWASLSKTNQKGATLAAYPIWGGDTKPISTFLLFFQLFNITETLVHSEIKEQDFWKSQFISLISKVVALQHENKNKSNYALDSSLLSFTIYTYIQVYRTIYIQHIILNPSSTIALHTQIVQLSILRPIAIKIPQWK